MLLAVTTVVLAKSKTKKPTSSAAGIGRPESAEEAGGAIGYCHGKGGSGGSCEPATPRPKTSHHHSGSDRGSDTHAAHAADTMATPPQHGLHDFQRQDQCLTVASGARRCFTLAEPYPRQPPRPAPVLLMHHGNGTDGLRFCIDSMKQVATKQGLALLCTSAANSAWQLGAPAPQLETLAGETNECDQSTNDDLSLVAKVLAFVRARPLRFDAARVFQAGFSSGALLAALSSVCFHQHVVGFGQAGASLSPKWRVVPTSPPLRVCIWCNRDDAHCHPADEALNEVGHHAEKFLSAHGGHEYPHPWIPRIVDCLRVFEARGAALIDGNFSAAELLSHLAPHARPQQQQAAAPRDVDAHACGRALPGRNWSRTILAAEESKGWTEYADLVYSILFSALHGRLCVVGTVGEVGVYYGGYFAVLAATAARNESLFACDTFAAVGDQRASLPRNRFHATLRRVLGDGFDTSNGRLHVLEASSLTLGHVRPAPAAHLLPPFRLLSIDADHHEVSVFSDLRWAASRLVSGGVIALNDPLHARWRGVGRATRSFFHLVDPRYLALRPLLVTAKKLYLTTPSHHRLYLRMLCQLHRSPKMQSLLLPPLPRAVPLRLSLMPLSALGNALTAAEPGWNGTAFADPLAERELPPVGLPHPRQHAIQVAVTRAALRRLAHVFKVGRGRAGGDDASRFDSFSTRCEG